MALSRIAVLIITYLACYGCKSRDTASQSKELYPTSRQRPANELEKAYVGKIETCTGFFIQNSKNKTLFMTARHCFNNSIPKEEGDQVDPTGTVAARRFCAHPEWGVITDGLGQKFSCKELVAGDDNFHDILLFEMREPRSGPSLRLAGFDPSVGANLTMIGYPSKALVGDNSFPWTVENCEVYATSVPSPWQNTPGKVSKDVSFTHDCSSYGGNSGGPILIEGTDVVAGIPTTYDPRIRLQNGAMNYRGVGKVSYAAAVSDFASAHRRKLIAVGISTVESDRVLDTRGELSYFRNGIFKGERSTCLNIRANYLLGESISSVSVAVCGQTTATDLNCSRQGSVVECLGLSNRKSKLIIDNNNSARWSESGADFVLLTRT